MASNGNGRARRSIRGFLFEKERADETEDIYAGSVDDGRQHETAGAAIPVGDVFVVATRHCQPAVD